MTRVTQTAPQPTSCSAGELSNPAKKQRKKPPNSNFTLRSGGWFLFLFQKCIYNFTPISGHSNLICPAP